MSQEGQDDPLHTDTPPPNTPPEPCQDTDSHETINVEGESQEDSAVNWDAGETETFSREARPDEKNGDALTKKKEERSKEEEERSKEEEQEKNGAMKNGETEQSNGDFAECEDCDDPLPQVEDSAEPRHIVRLVI